jgi:hypothetical protein
VLWDLIDWAFWTSELVCLVLDKVGGGVTKIKADAWVHVPARQSLECK